MQYTAVKEGRFRRRLNRFVAEILIDDAVEKVHVKNTGRLGELLLPDARVWLEHSDNSSRKTFWDLVTVEKAGVLFNIDSVSPNRAAGEWLQHGGLGYVPDEIKPEAVCGNSRFDFCFSQNGTSHYMEVKGVTLLRNGMAVFPDAPTLRGAKHLRELVSLQQQGIPCHLLFVVQTAHADGVIPNTQTDPGFASALAAAASAGVDLRAVCCHVAPDSLCITNTIPVILPVNDSYRRL